MRTVAVDRKGKEKYLDFDQLNQEEQENALWKLLLKDKGSSDGYLYEENRSLEEQVQYMRRVLVALTIQLYRKGNFSDDFMEKLLTKAEYGF